MHGIKKYFPLLGGFLLMVLTISLIVGYTYQERSQVTPKNPSEIRITIQGEKTSVVRKYIQDLNEMNPNLLGYCNEIVFTDKDVAEVAGVKDQMESGYNYLAITTGDGTITLSSQKHKDTTLEHELYHCLDFRYRSDGESLSSHPHFLSIYDKEKNQLPISSYLKSNPQETFAGCMLAYNKNPDELQSKAPYMFQYIQNMQNQLQKSQS